MGLVSTVKSWMGGRELSYRGPFSGVSELGNSFMIGPLDTGWQRNLDISKREARDVPGVYACVMLIARAIAQCYPKHVRKTKRGFEDANGPAYKVLRNPNSYQSNVDLLLNMTATALFEGEAFVVLKRNNRGVITEMHLQQPGSVSPMIDPDTRAVFYAMGDHPLLADGTDYILPQRDVMHLRFFTPRHPLVGESPIKAAMMAISTNVALSKSQAAFFTHMSRPSGILSYQGTPDRPFLDKGQMESLKQAWAAASQDWNQGKTPILGANMRFQPMGVSSQDAELIQAQRMSLEDICRCFGVPGPLVGDLSNATLSNAETLMQSFLSMSLGAYIEQVERTLDRAFDLPENEFVELDTQALLRTNFEGRIQGLVKGIQGGLFTPNEGRAVEGFGPVQGGDSAYLQRQMVPIDQIDHLMAAEANQPNITPTVPPEDASESQEVAKAMVAYRQKKLAQMLEA